ncbi:hypothetical protein V4R08_01525 [Nitrobacter sp. NHB1]|uniref:hypothetical protein n=1 Tax=Nitrobacter sp. NHB1 TaxID=3119830 RepID=UPI002FFFC560
MLTLALKFFFEKILPSVLTTVTAAYIVNHYIADKPADAPLTAAVPDKAGSNNPEAGVRAKGVSEKAVAKVEAGKVQPETAAAKPAEKKRAEIASLPTDTKKHQAARREKAAAKVTSTPAASAQVASVPDDHRDANDLARAAIDRLRGTNDAPVRVEASRPQSEVSRAQRDADRRPDESTSSRLQEVTRAAPQPAMQPLPPAIRVSTPAVEMLSPDATGMGESQVNSDDRVRLPVPPADIPPADIPQASRPLDLEANGAAPAMRTHTTVADDMLSAAKSVFQTVLPR